MVYVRIFLVCDMLNNSTFTGSNKLRIGTQIRSTLKSCFVSLSVFKTFQEVSKLCQTLWKFLILFASPGWSG